MKHIDVKIIRDAHYIGVSFEKGCEHCLQYANGFHNVADRLVEIFSHIKPVKVTNYYGKQKRVVLFDNGKVVKRKIK